LDPFDGEGLNANMSQFLRHPKLMDPQPSSEGADLAADKGHSGAPRLDTVDWPDETPGNLRVSYVLPSRDWIIKEAGVFWPAPDDRRFNLLGEDQQAAGPHRLVWVDISLPDVSP